ncbi:MAG: hypothetical protein M5U12_14485 [Verrucomicrobia bacterium]|nr:hypothetical protein [Verrucomicrobiota bacterium]
MNERFPGVRFEVVCAAATAVNSHALLPIARECAALDGDLWILYLGHNEMEGPFGVANPFGLRAPSWRVVRTLLALKTTRIGQLLAAGLDRASGTDRAARAWAGMKTMAQHLVPRPRPPRKPCTAISNGTLRTSSTSATEPKFPSC